MARFVASSCELQQQKNQERWQQKTCVAIGHGMPGCQRQAAAQTRLAVALNTTALL
jgi:hypothetical protein